MKFLPLYLLLAAIGIAVGQSTLTIRNGTSTYSNSTVSTLADADATLTPGVDSTYQILTATLTGNRTLTLSTTGAKAGDRFVIIRKGLGLFTLSVGGLKIVPSATTANVSVIYDGAAWQLENYSLL